MIVIELRDHLQHLIDMEGAADAEVVVKGDGPLSLVRASLLNGPDDDREVSGCVELCCGSS